MNAHYESPLVRQTSPERSPKGPFHRGLASIHDHLVNWKWHFLGISASIAAALGYWGFCLTLHPHTPIEYLRIIYLTAQLFVLESNLGPLEGLVLPLVIAQILAPLIFGFAAWQTAATIFRDQIRLMGLPFWKNHVVIVGLGEKGVRLVKEYRRRGSRVVVIEADDENDDIPVCWAHGATVLVGNAADSALLERVRVHRARVLFIVTGNDGVNVEVAVKAHLLVEKKKPAHTVRCFVHIIDANLCSLLRQHGLVSDNTDRFDAQVINVNDLSARLLLLGHSLDWHSGENDGDAQPHLVILGFGGMGESVALQAAKIGHYAHNKNIRISVLDRNARFKESVFLSRYPQFHNAAPIDFMEMEFGTGECFEALEGFSKEQRVRLSVAICINDNSSALSLVLSLQNRLPGVPLYVRLDAIAGPATLLKETRYKTGTIVPFGMLDTSCLPPIIENDTLDVLARAIHRNFVEQNASSRPADDPAIQSWERLPLTFKESNRSQADHIPVKMRDIGCTVVTADSAGEAITEFTPEELDVLSRMEHARWNAERYLDGWQFGKIKNTSKKENPNLVPWEKLSREIQKYDTDAVRLIPVLVERMGWKVVRERNRQPGAHRAG